MDSPSQKFKIIHNELKHIVNENCQDEQLLQKKMTKYIAQMVDGSDDEQQKMFDHFCEYGGSEILASLIKVDPLLAIKTFSLLFINLKNQMWVSFILCQPFLMQAISLKPNSIDEEYTQYFVSFLKSLSIRINDAQVTLFYNKKNCTFPLAMAAMSYFNHPDFMVRTSVMNILLQLMKIKQEKTRQYFSRFPFTSYIILFACEINQLFQKFAIKLKQNHKNLTEKNFTTYQVDFSDYLYYFNDLIQFGSEKLVQIIQNIIISYLVLPIFQMISEEDPLSRTHGLLLVYECLRILKSRNILDIIICLLLNVNISLQLKEKISNMKDIHKPFMFQKQFNPSTSFWAEYENQVIRHCLQVFRQIQKFDISFQEETKQRNPKFYEQANKIGQFINYDLLKDQLLQQAFISRLKSNQQSQIANPFRQRLFSYLKNKQSQEYAVCTSILLIIFKNTTINEQEKSVFYQLIVKQLTSILLEQMAEQIVWQKIKIKNIGNILNLLRFIIKEAQQLDFEQSLLRNYKQIIEHLKEYTKTQNMLFTIQNFYKIYKQIQNSIQKPYSQDIIPYNLIIRPIQNWNQEYKQFCLPQKSHDKIIYYSYLFFIFRNFVDYYFNKFYEVQYPNFEKEYERTLFSTFQLWVVGNYYMISDRTRIVCQLERKDQKKKVKVLIIEDQFNFVLAQLSDKQGCKILANTSWKNMNFQLNKEDATLLQAILTSDDGNEKYKLYFQDQIRSNSTLVRMNDIKWQCYEYELSFINKFLKNAYED